MGKLIRLELFNFKSYKGHHVLRFGDSYFTSIIGPNGSGKSNSMDAISFVLGIKSSHLRSSQLKDLIYRGRVLKTSKIGADGSASNGSESLSTAQSSTQPEDQEEEESERPTRASGRHEPQSAWVMAVYEDDAGDEQTWKRSITASGSSEYRINNRLVSAKQYNEALEAENILIKARNFLVFQGDVEAIANQNPRELTRLIEQISGSGEYKAEYERLKAESERAAEEQAYMLQQRRGINQEIKQYQDQKREVDAYDAKKNERDRAIVDHIVWKLYTFQTVLDNARPAIQRFREQLKEHRRQNATLEAALDTERRQQAASGRDLAAAERAIKQADRVMHDRENALVPIREKLAISRRNLEKYTTRLEDIRREQSAQQAVVNRLQKDSDTVRRAYDLWQQQWDDEQRQQGQTLTEQDLQEYNELRKNVGTQTALAQAQVDALSRELQFLEEEKTRHSGQLNRLRSQFEKLESDLQVLNNAKNNASSRQASLQSELETKNQTLRALDSERVRIARARTELDEKLQDVLRKLTEADSGRRETERETRLKETIAGLKRIYPGVKGRVTDLCRPKQRRFDNAVATVLGRHLDSVVVDTEKTAKDCINYLREQRAGQATFIPLDTIAVSAGNAAVKGLMDGVRMAIDTIEFDPSVERAMLYVCADAVVCNDLATARDLRFNRRVDVKAVTLDGTVIHRAGLMTGGRTNENSGRRRWEASEIDTLNKLREKLMGELASLPSRPTIGDGDESGMDEEHLKVDVARLGQQLEFLRDEIATLERNISSREREVANTRAQIEQLTPVAEQVEATVEQKRTQMSQTREQVISVEDRVFAAFCRRHGFENIRAYEERQGSAQQRAAEKRLEFTTQLSRLENQLTFERSRLSALEDRLARLQTQKQADAQVVTQAEAELLQAEEEIATLAARRDGELTEAIEAARQAHERRTQKVTRARADLAEAGSAIEETIKELETVEAEARRVAAARYGLLRKCKIDEISIPVAEGSKPLASLPLDVIPDEDSQEVLRGGTGDDEDGMDVDGDGDEDPLGGYGIEIDFSELDDELKEDSSAIETELLDRISTLTSELERMAPNMRATSRLDEVEARLAKTERDFESARRAARAARDEFDAVKSQRLQLFNRAFTHISEQIGPVYKDLTRSDAFPLGGQAYLDSEDSEEPYLAGLKYHAMPPLKRFRDMEHLSGGEKTMAALALLFSIHSFQPSPFFVLDEVDAALDNANVGKIARYIADHSGPGMQFIVISLKLGLFCQSETLVGIMRDQGKNSSMALTLDLRKYNEEGGRREVPGVVTGFSGL